jgi:S-adenosylmethionine:tRNA ribosyltransferase-isomerase
VPAAPDRTPMDRTPMDRTPMDRYAYDLPDEAVAQHPVEPRTAARLLVAAGLAGPEPAHRRVADLPELLGPGDVVVVNDTRVLAARLALHKATGGSAEVLLLEPDRAATPSDGDGAPWLALVRPGQRLPAGTRLAESPGGPAVVEVGAPVGGDDGRRHVVLLDPSVVERAGTMPLPPYITTPLADASRYQTTFAGDRAVGDRSAAAPTAGLHFTPGLLDACRRAGAGVARVDLVIGLDTFRPVSAEFAEDHAMHSERYRVPVATARACERARRVVAVGTTTTRALEAAAATGERSGRTDLYIHGEYRFAVVDVLLTNFHLPRSSLLLLVEAFCGPGWRELYATALSAGYRFLSFGDAMVVGRRGSPWGMVP